MRLGYYTSCAQSQFLVDHGIDMNTADAYNLIDREIHLINSNSGDSFSKIAETFPTDFCYPCWSAFKLFDLFPEKLLINEVEYYLFLTKKDIYYLNIRTGEKLVGVELKGNPILAMINMILKLSLKNIKLF